MVNLRSAAVLGGGPGGLYVARLLKLSQPGCRVDVYEQSSPELTFGFGVGLAGRTQRNLQAADPDSLAEIVGRAWEHDMAMAVGDRTVRLPAGDMVAIGRSTLLGILRRHAAAAGVHLHYGSRVTAQELDADLVIAADGISSATREAHHGAFGAEVITHDGLYLWCGTDFALPSAIFRPVETEFGFFTTHAYPYQADRSTFLIEASADTWRLAGFDETTARTPLDASDEQSLSYLTKAFHDDLQGQPLIGNRTRWLQFRTVTCARWHRGNVVLLGDAVHTAHYSIGSGTKLAMEDGITLARALAEAVDLEAALSRYEAERRPAVQHLQEIAHRSMQWWDSFPGRLDLPVEQLLIAFMTRAGKVSIDRFAGIAPDVVRAGLAQFAGCPVAAVPEEDLVSWVLGRPLDAAGHHWGSRLVDTAGDEPLQADVPHSWGPAADALVGQARDRAGTGPVVVVAAPGSLESTLTLFEVSERLRREAGRVVVARVAPQWREYAAAALASGRIDLVDLNGVARRDETRPGTASVSSVTG
jgi:anthraniloyl-CoA monooxygenase